MVEVVKARPRGSRDEKVWSESQAPDHSFQTLAIDDAQDIDRIPLDAIENSELSRSEPVQGRPISFQTFDACTLGEWRRLQISDIDVEMGPFSFRDPFEVIYCVGCQDDPERPH
jgi:hypothetical protein